MAKDENNHRASLPAPDMEPDSGHAPVVEKKAAGLDPLVNIRVISYRKRKHDPDGISVKAVLDGIVRRGLLKDDSWDEIKEVRFESRKCAKGEEEKTIIEIEELCDAE